MFGHKKQEAHCDSCGGEVSSHVVSHSTSTMPHGPTISAPPSVTLPAEPMSSPLAPAEPINKPREEPGTKMPPTTLMPPAVELAPPTSNVTDPETKHPFELSRRYEKRVERAADYSKITGQLFYVHADGGLWVLRYAPVGDEDPNGGGVILARTHQMDSYREGDLVTVRGSILDSKRSPHLGAPLYRAQAIELVDRGQ